jgi:hypothetical protein
MGTEGLPFAPFSAVLRDLVRDLGADGVAGLLPGHATREVARLLPEFGAMEQETDASTARARLFEQILALLERLADEVHRRAEGNPLFLEELLSRDGEPNAQLPESLRDLLLAAVRRLPEETQDVLRAASAAGPGIEHSLLAAVTGLDDDALARALRPAVAANVLVVRGDGCAFRHALIREAVYDDLLPGERTRRHTRFAEALRSDPGLVAPGRAMIEEAHHWYHAHNTTWALISAWHAAADARHALASAEQLTLLAWVLELWDQVPDARAAHQHQPPGRPGAGGRGRADRGRERARHLLRHGRAERGGCARRAAAGRHAAGDARPPEVPPGPGRRLRRPGGGAGAGPGRAGRHSAGAGAADPGRALA